MPLPIGDNQILLGLGEGPVTQRLDRANRHGFVAGATGTGKTVTLQVMAQAFSDAGVPVFAADVKGDLSGLAMPGAPNEKMLARAAAMDLALAPSAPPVIFWDLFGQKGHPIRATISEMGPLLLSRLLELNDVQEGVLTIAFHVADQEGLLLLDLKDLQAALKYVADQADEIGTRYGNVSAATVGAIQRKLLTLQTQGGEAFFGEPALDLSDLMRTDAAGRGYVSLLAADRLIQSPRLYGTFLMWLLSEMFESLPEVGDPEKPRLVFFFDEAHLLFNDAPKALLEKIEQVVRLIRSKGVGVYFVTQNPADIPDTVLGQLGARVQHALRAYTPADQKGLKAAAQSFRTNPGFDTAEAIQALGVGEALVSTLDEKGAPQVVQKTLIRPPASRLGPITPPERAALQGQSPVRGVYDAAMDRDSAYEILQGRADQAQRQAKAKERELARDDQDGGRRASGRQTMAEAFAVTLVRTVASQAGRELMRGLLGGLTRRRR
ncbi:helicase HerA-like C-terminal domain-containing protein [Caulobacter segnis]|uniref:ATP-binding protein n=1 Tax=Caulobacter segnis TaxID=88688 RepID=A0A2W5XGC1_9CAUL|nr:helicase HerA-like C-terminal domain-containing protein [Caulobacter segnis]PZR36821.1 MAG: ATP-binding protein [Caulobacter segnis]